MQQSNLEYSLVIPPHPPNPSPTGGEGEPVKVPLPSWAIHYAKVGETFAVSGLPTLREEQALHPPAPSPKMGEGEPD